MKTKNDIDAKIEKYIMDSFNNPWANRHSPLSLKIASKELKISPQKIGCWARKFGGFKRRHNCLYATDEIFKKAKEYEKNRIVEKKFEEYETLILNDDFAITPSVKIPKGSEVSFLRYEEISTSWIVAEFHGFEIRVLPEQVKSEREK